jgi:hypothetical protein
VFRRFFPDSVFRRRLTEAAERRLRLAHARADERIIDAHVANALMFVDTLAEDLSFDRAIDTYIRVMSLSEPVASMVATRALVVLGQELVPERVPRPDGTAATAREPVDAPAVRLPGAPADVPPESPR